MTANCAHCNNPIEGRRRAFCCAACRTAAYRRRKVGLAEDFNAGRGRRGRVALTALTKNEKWLADEIILEFEEIELRLKERFARG